MKILLTADPELPVPPGLYGGIERIVDVLVNEYTDRGHEVTLCANPASKVPCTLVGWKGHRSQNMGDTLKNALTLSYLVYTGHFDIIHSFSRLAYMTAVFPLRIPKIMSYQREPSHQQVSKATKLSRKGSMVFTGCSHYIAGQLENIAESYTVYNCAPMEKYIPTASVEADAPLAFLGRVEQIKGAHIAVEVAKKSGKRLLIAGNIPAESEVYFNEKIKPFLDDRIVYIGPVNDEQKNEILGKSLAFLMPIQWNEPFGIVMAEAMACGTPILGFPFGSVPEIINNGLNGFICRDTEEMVAKLTDIGTLDRKKVREYAERKFSNTKITEDYLSLYSDLIKRARRN